MRMTAHVCDQCAPGLFYGDWTALDLDHDIETEEDLRNLIPTVAELLGEVADTGRVSDGYADCYLCGATEVDIREFSAVVTP